MSIISDFKDINRRLNKRPEPTVLPPGKTKYSPNGLAYALGYENDRNDTEEKAKGLRFVELF